MSTDLPLLRVRWLGKGIPYAEGMVEMRRAIEAVDDDGPVLLLLEHAPIVTVTRQHGTTHVVTDAATLAADGIALVETDRGGDVTFHGPGQLVGYPIFRLSPAGERADVIAYLRQLEGGLVDAVTVLGVANAHREDGATGVWVPMRGSDAPSEKLVAIGIGVGGGVTRHGFALNVTTALERYTRHVVPCGLHARSVTSLERLLAALPDDDTLRTVVARAVAGALRHHLEDGTTGVTTSSASDATRLDAFSRTTQSHSFRSASGFAEGVTTTHIGFGARAVKTRETPNG